MQKFTISKLEFSTHEAAEAFRNEIASVPCHDKTDIVSAMDSRFRETHECRSTFSFDEGEGLGFTLFVVVGILLRHNQISLGDHPLFQHEEAVRLFSNKIFDLLARLASTYLADTYGDFTIEITSTPAVADV